MRVGYDVDLDLFRGKIAGWTLGQLKDFLLEGPGEEIAPLGFALTSVMSAAVCKLMDVHDLVLAARNGDAQITATRHPFYGAPAVFGSSSGRNSVRIWFTQ